MVAGSLNRYQRLASQSTGPGLWLAILTEGKDALALGDSRRAITLELRKPSRAMSCQPVLTAVPRPSAAAHPEVEEAEDCHQGSARRVGRS
jgi:hypothetical protein